MVRNLLRRCYRRFTHSGYAGRYLRILPMRYRKCPKCGSGGPGHDPGRQFEAQEDGTIYRLTNKEAQECFVLLKMAWWRMNHAMTSNNVLNLSYRDIADFVRKIQARSDGEEDLS